MARTLNDGHFSPLDYEVMDGGALGDQLADIKRSITAVRRNVDTSIPVGKVGFPALWASNRYAGDLGVLANMAAIDPIRLVSGNEITVIAGEPCIVGPADLYFEVSALDDAETLDASAGAYGWRSNTDHDVDVYLRLHNNGGDLRTVDVTYLAGGTVSDLVTTGGDTWQAMNVANRKHLRQNFTAPTSGVVSAIDLYLKRAAGATGQLWVQFWQNPGVGDAGASIWGVCATIDVSTLTTGGDWVTVELTSGMPITSGQSYGFSVVNVDNADVSMYSDTSTGYAGGKSGYYDDTARTWVESTSVDYYLKVTTGGESTSQFVCVSTYEGWQERMVNLAFRCNHYFYSGDNAADFHVTLPEGLALSAIGLLETVTGGFPQWRAGHVRTRHIASPVVSPVVVSSLTVNQTQDDVGDVTYEDCAGTASITTTQTCTIVIDAGFVHRTDNADYFSSVKLVDASDTNVGTVIRQTKNTNFEYAGIKARLTEQPAGTYTYNLMHTVGHATATGYVDEKQIEIIATPE